MADLFLVDKRGYIRQGYFADFVLVDLKKSTEVTRPSLLYKCGWSPFEGHTFHSKIIHTFVNGNHVFNNGIFDETSRGKRLLFNR